MAMANKDESGIYELLLSNMYWRNFNMKVKFHKLQG